ncbi:ribonuclease [Streptomyces sp. SID13666]|uniref:ribonuclease domain-containing protein n=1 Tax=unclassified Streptomyces TaxID=2593676 RepID=UPI0013BF18FE|nr:MULTISPECIES: ribonuclease domain-containing protein [unclassified Streptomyces]NEA59621.1 ribonuclease [Streptomyces sp. SID13666]NEA75761.1 ribonuclease [Streptomyces sp. SID13588]
MRTPRLTRIGALAVLAGTLLVGGPAVAASPAALAPTSAAVGSSATVTVNAVGSICYSALPSQAHHTLDLIDAGGPFPYSQDGVVFRNQEQLLPSHTSGYYHEYTVVTPGSPTRGARRIITGQAVDEDYYTADHYASFKLVDFSC